MRSKWLIELLLEFRINFYKVVIVLATYQIIRVMWKYWEETSLTRGRFLPRSGVTWLNWERFQKMHLGSINSAVSVTHNQCSFWLIYLQWKVNKLFRKHTIIFVSALLKEGQFNQMVLKVCQENAHSPTITRAFLDTQFFVPLFSKRDTITAYWRNMVWALVSYKISPPMTNKKSCYGDSVNHWGGGHWKHW